MADAVSTADICAHCGVCCTGAMFSHVPFRKPDDRAKLERNGHPPIDEDATSFALPCRFQQGTLCSIYQDRPHICSAYRCLVLERAQDGDLAPDEAVGHARELARLYRELREKMPPGETLPQMRERIAGLRAGNDAIVPKDGELMLAYYAFNIYLDRYFWRPDERHVEYAKPA